MAIIASRPFSTSFAFSFVISSGLAPMPVMLKNWPPGYAGLPEPIRAKDVVGDVRSFACEAVRAAFRHPDAGDATVTIKER